MMLLGVHEQQDTVIFYFRLYLRNVRGAHAPSLRWRDR